MAATATALAPANQDAINQDKINHLDEIEALVRQLNRASPSGAETMVERIHDHIGALREEQGGPKYISAEERALKMPLPNAGRDPRAAGRNPPGPLTPPGVAFPVGVDVKDRSDNLERAPVPVGPADPSDVEDWQRNQAKTGVAVPLKDPEAERNRLANEAAELKRVSDLREQNAGNPGPKAATPPAQPGPLVAPADANGQPQAAAEQVERDRAEAERRRRVMGAPA